MVRVPWRKIPSPPSDCQPPLPPPASAWEKPLFPSLLPSLPRLRLSLVHGRRRAAGNQTQPRRGEERWR